VYEDSDIIIEDYAEDQEGETVVLRQVIFPENPKVVQSEIPLIYRNTKNSKTAVSDDMKATSVLCPAKKQREVVFDRNTLTFEIYHAMLSALSLVPISK
jgi:hypothetical protein